MKKITMRIEVEYDAMKHDMIKWLMSCPVLSEKGKEEPIVTAYLNGEKLDLDKREHLKR